jgi:integrase
METVTGTQNLISRGGVWYYNRRVPKKLVPALGRKIIRKSLATGDKSEAKKLRAVLDVKWDARFENLLSTSQPQMAINSDLDFEHLVRNYVERKSKALDERLKRSPPQTDDDLRERLQEADETLDTLKNPENIELDPWVYGQGRQILHDAGLDGSLTEAESANFDSLLVRGLVELTRRELAHYSNDHSRKFYDYLFDGSQPNPVPFGLVGQQYLGERIEEAHANHQSEKWIEKLTALVDVITEIIGPDMLVSSIDYDVCLRVRSQLAQLPANRKKKYPNLPIESVLRRAADDKAKTLSPTSQAIYLRTFTSILDLAARKSIIAVNPAAKLRPLTRDHIKDAAKRRPFDLPQIVEFFQSDFYKSCASGAVVPYTGSDFDWRFWLPLVCLFQGLRPNEACQLSVENIKRSDVGTWYFEIVDSPDSDGNSKPTKTLKTAASRRCVPVHPELAKIGFFDYLKRRHFSDGDGAYLLPGLSADRHGNRAKYALRRFNERFLPQAIVVKERQSFYSFRHSFRDSLRRIDAPPATLRALGGWSQGSLVSDAYGDPYNPDLQKKWIKKVGFPGLDLSTLYGAFGSGKNSSEGDFDVNQNPHQEGSV